MTRTLRSKHLRAALWLAADGRCQRCGEQLPAIWHGDHTLGWWITQDTNVHEMQALCVRCNLEKGTSGLRAHQAELTALFREVEAGRRPLPKRIGCYVCCGGGKQGLAGIAAHWLIERLRVVDAVCWVTPNGSLRRQAAESFLPSDWLAKAVGHHIEIYESANDLNPSKGRQGYAITAHALAADKYGINLKEFERRRYALIVDEFHHFPIDSEWERAIRPLVERAHVVVMMTGTLDRLDRKPLMVVDYGTDGLIDRTPRSDFWWVNYPISAATRERAIVEAQFTLSDAEATWRASAQRHTASTLGDDSRALFTALRTEFADQLLADCYRDWVGHRVTNPGAKMLVVCSDVRQARHAKGILLKLGADAVDIATYLDDEADDNIRRFQGLRLKPAEQELFILDTVAKAYEGMDCKAITHLACLTHIRGRQWIEQTIGRAWRFDPKAGPWNMQRARIWAPADDAFRACIKHIQQEQELAIRAMETENNGGGGGDRREPFVITPIESVVTDVMSQGLDGSYLDPVLTERYRRVAAMVGVSVSPLDLHRIALELENDDPAPSTAGPNRTSTERTPQERWWEAKAELESAVSAAAAALFKWAGGRDLGECKKEVNLEVVRHLGKRRDDMTEDELDQAALFVRQRYDLPD